MLLPATTLLVLAAAADAVNWLTFTASVPATPSARPVIFLLPMAMPALLSTGPPLLIVTLSNATSGFVATVIVLSDCVTAMFGPSTNFTVSFDPTFTAVLLLA